MFKLKKPLIIGGVIVAAGAAMMIGSANKANFDFGWDKGPKLVTVRQNKEVFKDVKNLTVNANAGMVRIVEGSEWSVTTWAVDGQQATATKKDDRLTVDTLKDESVLRGVFLSTPEAFQYSALVTVPTGTNIDELNLSMEDGGIVIDGISAKKTKTTTGRGGLNLHEFKGESLEMTTKDGRLAMDDVTLKSLKFTGRDAYVYGSYVKVTEASQIDIRDGSVNLSRVQAPGFNLKSGDFDDAYVHMTKFSEEDERVDFESVNYGYEDEAVFGDDESEKEYHDQKDKLKEKKTLEKGDQKNALKVTVRNGQILFYEMDK
ncbi:DUF4097 family beta strand repeat-containing protein [Weissella tructae]|uniref:DUF4097 domain-containing protein n=2 Tax=Weissella TaxID=46255 RepID=A0A075U0N9_9LACO|nr:MULTISPECIES: DUF4097 family beta strand repeat-containing protein [Weissella]AIG65758.1 hypothetical protein WS08_0819 [Weissella tructae]AIM63137.1 hypothetical protein WS74_0885 [Weissella ceti]AIM64473.1 hypothetical protein WS105_0883 [Weissella ceti]ELA06789.1 hypothetical protein WCNC_04397 [Weissella ceti NC36]QVV90921.1 DUF4097 family beta strand repeat protein [Weissella tructae]